MSHYHTRKRLAAPPREAFTTLQLSIMEHLEPVRYPGLIMELTARRISIHTRHPFRIARDGGSTAGRDVVRVILRIEHDGVVGYGEAAPTTYYRQSPDSVEETVERIAADERFLGDDPFQIVPIIHRLINAFDDQRATIAAIDAALHDWVAKRLNVPVWKILGLNPTATPATSMTIGIDEPDRISEKVTEASPFGILKIKVGTERDEETLSIVRAHAPGKRLRLDANCAWTPENALGHIKALARFEPEMIEQPIAAGQRDALRELHQDSPIPIYVDEDCIRPEDVPKLAGCVAGVNIKLAKCGGIREALRAITLARSVNLKVMIGCMVETSLGIAAAAQCASLVDLVDLDGHLLLADDPFTGLLLDGDRVLPGADPGLGVNAEDYS